MLRGETALVGVGETKVGIVKGKDVYDLHFDAMNLALDDAGLTRDDIDGLIVAESRSGMIVPGAGAPPYTSDRVPPFYIHGPRLAEYLGLKVHYALTFGLGGATVAQMVHMAACAVAAGMAHTILVMSADDMYSNVGRDLAVKHAGESGSHPSYDLPYGITQPGFHALQAQRHMHEYGTTPEQLADVAVEARSFARLNENAHMRGPLTREDVLASRMISSPLHLFDCAPISDGGAAIIVTSHERATSLRERPVWLLGAGQGHAHMYVSQMESLAYNEGTRLSAETAFRMAGIDRKDVDIFMPYDAFTIMVLMQLEDVGFCAAGEAGAFVQSGAIGLGGQLPCNTHGGLLSHGHPRRPGALFAVVEAVEQLRGAAESRQVVGAEIAVIQSMGGPVEASNCTLILAKERS